MDLNYKLVAIDLDGTLLTEGYEIEPAALDAIQSAAKMGVKFTIATGRMHGSAARFAEELGVEVPLITYNGSVVRCAISGNEYRHLKVPREAAIKALSLVGSDRALRYVFTYDRVITDTPDEWTDRYARILGVEMHLTEDLANTSLDDDPTMIVFMCEEGRTKMTTDLLAQELDSSVRLTNSNPWFVDVLHKDASKASSLRYVADKLGILIEETIAIGDSWNDLEMIEAAGVGVAVANATEKLKERADYVTSAERGAGVAEVLEKFVL
ncbi:MAG: Cof-type HAD-IIB family hydrolase [Actinobacteria bacterium]|nr:Cof-type HAD-IIB family hydrolase [Actinomycetota bacterium]